MGGLCRRGVIAVIGAMLGSGCAVAPAGPDTIYIGIDLPLSGPRSAVGTVHHNALRLRTEQANQQQLAGERYRLELRVLDNHGDPEISARNLAELGADSQVAAIVTAGCPDCVSTGGLAVPTISLDPVDVLDEPDQYLFQLGPIAADNADRLSQRMAAAGVATVGVVGSGDRYGQVGADQFAAASARDGMRIVIQERVGSGSTVAAAAAVAAWRPPDAVPGFDPDPAPSGPDAVVIWAAAPLAAEVAAALREAGYDGPLYLDMTGADDLFLAGDALAYEGATLVLTETAVIDQMITASPAAAARNRWFTSYLSRFGTYHLHASWAADAVGVLAQAVAGAGRTDPGVLRDRLEDTRIDGVTGLIRFTAAQHAGLHPTSLILLTAAGGRWYPTKEETQ